MKKSFTAKLWKVMRICAVQAVIAITLCGVTLAHPNYAQVLDREISITIIDLPFEKALNEIEHVAKVKFGYSINQFQDEPNVSLSIEKKTLRDVLDELLAPRKIRYKVHEKEAAITLKKITVESEKDQSSIHDGSNGSAQHQALIHVTGTVTEASTRTPMAGVNVIVKGTTNGTTTDAAGRYNVGAENNDVLIFSFIGYASLEIPVNGRTVIDVVMTEDVQSLNEVVVNAGYWEVKDQERTGNIVRVTSDEIQKQPVSNPLQALQGRMAGVYIQQNTGMPGGGFTIRIRGRNSIRNEGNEPLYLIDGVPYNGTTFSGSAGSQIIPNGSPFNALSPDDIESIDVLKDADATAIYGSRGANGVVLITTKKGRPEKTHLDVNVYHGFSQVSNFLDLLKTQQYVEMRREAFSNDNYTPSPSTDADMVSWDTTRYTNWQKELIGGTAQTSNARISLSGGNANTQFLISSGYFRQTTVFPGDYGNEKMSALVSVSHKPENDRFNVAFSASYVYDKNNLVRQDPTFYITLPPNAPSAFNSNGELNWENGTWINPYALLKRPYEGRTGNLVASLGLKYRILEGLAVKTNMGYSVLNASQFAAEPIKTNSPTSSVKTGSSTFSENNINTWNIEPQLEYQRTIGKGNLNLLVGTTFQQQMQTGNDIRATGYSSDALLKNIKAATTLNIIDAREILYRYNALFGRINFIWDDKYIVNLTARRDGSSRFGKENQFANFGAAGVAWIFSKESIFGSNKWLSFGKLRSSYGITGSDQIGDYQYLDTYRATSRTYQGQGGLIPSRLANPSYSWETNLKFEAALELGLFKDRIRLSSSWFRNRSSDQLVGYSLPSMTGFTSVQYNLPATVQNTGWEWEVSTTNIDKDNFSWTTALNITRPRNRLVDYPNLEGSSYVYFYEIGKSLYIRKMFHFTGVDPQTGIYTFEDKNENGNGTDNPDDLQTRKEIAHDFFGGIQNTLSYKGFELSFLLQFVKQTGSSHFTSSNFVAPGRQGNQLTEVMNRWQQPGDETNIQKFTAYFASDAARIYSTSTYAGDQAIVDASFIRLQNIYFGWNLPSHWLRKVTVKSARLYCQGQNIFTLTNYTGLSPETQSQSVLPPLRTLTFGIQVSL
jgi:TonB-linked SusC/RagA family outer membrane protein